MKYMVLSDWNKYHGEKVFHEHAMLDSEDYIIFGSRLNCRYWMNGHNPCIIVHPWGVSIALEMYKAKSSPSPLGCGFELDLSWFEENNILDNFWWLRFVVVYWDPLHKHWVEELYVEGWNKFACTIKLCWKSSQ